MHDATDNAPIVCALDASHIRRQTRLNPIPLLIAQPKQVLPHGPDPPKRIRHTWNQDCFAPAAKLMSSHPSNRFLNVKHRLQRLRDFCLIFGQKNFQFGEMVTEDPSTGEITMPYYSFSREAERFIKTCYECDLILPDFDWGTWKGTAEALELRDNPDAMARATPDQIAKLLTVLVRLERFCDGSLAGAFKSGLLVAILRRAMALAHEE